LRKCPASQRSKKVLVFLDVFAKQKEMQQTATIAFKHKVEQMLQECRKAKNKNN
jgi:hypothetical protein